MQRYIYNASAVAIGGRIVRPIDRHIDTVACVLPPTGGAVSSSGVAFELRSDSGDLILSYASAEASARGEVSRPGIYTTTTRSIIRDLNVENVLRAEEIVCALTVTFDAARDRTSIDTEGSRFVKLTIDGQDVDIALDSALGREASDYERFRQTARAGQYSEIRGKTYGSLATGSRVGSEVHEHGYIDLPNFGRIYVGEWFCAPYTQGLTMLRLKLGSPAGGEVMLSGDVGNGVPYP